MSILSVVRLGQLDRMAGCWQVPSRDCRLCSVGARANLQYASFHQPHFRPVKSLPVSVNSCNEKSFSFSNLCCNVSCTVRHHAGPEHNEASECAASRSAQAAPLHPPASACCALLIYGTSACCCPGLTTGARASPAKVLLLSFGLFSDVPLVRLAKCCTECSSHLYPKRSLKTPHHKRLHGVATTCKLSCATACRQGVASFRPRSSLVPLSEMTCKSCSSLFWAIFQLST